MTDDREMSHEVLNAIANSLDVSVQDVTDMNTRLKSHDGSLNVQLDRDTEDSGELLDFVADSKPNQEEVIGRNEIMSQRRVQFSAAWKCLNPREKDILFKRRLCEKAITLEDLSKYYSISKERVRQIELNSIRKIRNNIMQ